MAIDGVAVLGDFLRPDAQGRPGGVDRPTLWLANAIKRQIALAAGLNLTVVTPTALPALAAWVAAQRPAGEADAWWAARFAALPAPPPMLADALRGRFCVTYEAPPYLLALLDGLGAPWLDVRLHPVRFLDDLLFAVRAACPRSQAALADFAVPESLPMATAGLLEAMGQLISEPAVPEGTLLVLGQRPLDASQIVAGTFYDAFAHAAEIHRICAAYPAVALKLHPAGEAHSLPIVAANAPARVLGVIADNLYRMLALPQVAAVLTVNSSAAVEAGYFGKRAHTLAPPPLRPVWRGESPESGAHVSLGDVLLTPDFWRAALAPHARVTAPDGMRLPTKPNRLRIALDSFWNFQEIDTDRVPRGRA